MSARPQPTAESGESRRTAAALAVASQIAGVVYLVWRFGWTRHGASAPLFGLVFLVDLWVFVRHVLRCRSWSKTRPARSGVNRHLAPNRAALLLDVGQEPLLSIRVAIRACQEVAGNEAFVVLDRLNRPDVETECRRARVPRVAPTGGQHEVDVANAFAAAATSPLIAVIPASVWILPDALAVAAPSFRATLREPVESGEVAAVGLRAELSPDRHGEAGSSDRSGYPLFDDAYYRHGDVGAANEIVVIRADALRAVGGFHGGYGVGNGSFASRTVDALVDAGYTTSMAEAPGARRPAPWDEDVALRARLDEVSRQQQTHSGRRIIEAWSVVPRTFMLCLAAIVALTGLLPFTFGFAEVVAVAGPWFALAALARRAANPGADWSDLRAGARTATADFVGLARGSALAIRPGGLAARHARVALGGVVVAAVGCFAQVLGLRAEPLPTLAHGLVIAASVALLVLVRDSIWAQSDRERRSLPRIAGTNALTTSISPFGATLDLAQTTIGHLTKGDVVRLRLRVSQPQRSDWERVVTAVASGDGGYVQFDLDEPVFDQLLYGCAVIGAAHVSSVEKTRETRPFARRSLTAAMTQGRGAFVAPGVAGDPVAAVDRTPR